MRDYDEWLSDLEPVLSKDYPPEGSKEEKLLDQALQLAFVQFAESPVDDIIRDLEGFKRAWDMTVMGGGGQRFDGWTWDEDEFVAFFRIDKDCPYRVVINPTKGYRQVTSWDV